MYYKTQVHDQILCKGTLIQSSWPSQHHMIGLIRDLKLKVIHQEDADDGRVRIWDGAACIIEGIASRLKDTCITLSVTATVIEKMGNIIKVTVRNANSEQDILYTKHLVWTGPPRMALSPFLQWSPLLSNSKMTAQQSCSTWMASVTKVAFIYEKKYWDDNWIMEMKRGIYFYRDGEAFDIYDACLEQNENDIYAFTLFALIDWSKYDKNGEKSEQNESIEKRLMEQLLSIATSKRMLSSQTNNPSVWLSQYKICTMHHWPNVSSISDDPSPSTVGSHPYPNASLSQPEWKSDDGIRDLIFFAGTESDLRSPGLMEGAVGSAYRVMDELKRNWM